MIWFRKILALFGRVLTQGNSQVKHMENFSDEVSHSHILLIWFSKEIKKQAIKVLKVKLKHL